MAAWGYKDMVRLLLERGADVGARAKKQFTPLHNAALNGHDEVVRLLLERGADIGARNSDGDTALDLANRSDRAEEIARILGEKRGNAGRR